MTPKEKANKLCAKYYSRIMHTLSEEYSPHEMFIVKQCALIAVDEILKCVNNPDEYYLMEYSIFYWQEVKQEIENL